MHILNILITYMVITIFGIPNPTSVYKFPSHMYAYQIFVRKSFCVCDCAKLLSHIFFICLFVDIFLQCNVHIRLFDVHIVYTLLFL